ncbi:MAG: thioredoxin family protein [Planctomycetes bacterium]|jgi:hypothetical protein|nr:thioredoxin family protein [Planctomycetota bacterium]
MRQLGAILLLALAPAVHAAPAGWLGSLEEGTKAAARSGRPILVITIWKPGT